ncbi:type I 3-dehydroquinate dehydratase [candidate division NPL-UPA2 bacterium]|nr:type I 3-dehydroquinate dehydratase [candidate division NPL-UPA2 bacterium]
MLSIGNVSLGQGPRIVAVIWGSELVELAARAKEDGADLLEVRIDLFKKVNLVSLKKELKVIRQKVKLPLIATVRRRDEGGGYRYLERERLHLLESLIPLIDVVDIELRSKGIAKKVIRRAKLKKKKVLISYHNLVKTPSDEKLETIACQAKEMGGDIVKIATLANDRDEVTRLMIFTYRCPCRPLISISLGWMGAISRILAPFFGSCLTYAYVDSPAAPGQLSVSQLKQELKKFF